MFWRRLGDFISAITTKGLHTGNTVSPQVRTVNTVVCVSPSITHAYILIHQVQFWLCELRKRTFSSAYNMDKNISTFMGRPPRLPRKYYAMQLPLDIDLTQLRLPAKQMEIEIEKLGEGGWNTGGEIRSNLYARTSLICNMIREDILELELASLPSKDIAVAENYFNDQDLHGRPCQPGSAKCTRSNNQTFWQHTSHTKYVGGAVIRIWLIAISDLSQFPIQ